MTISDFQRTTMANVARAMLDGQWYRAGRAGTASSRGEAVTLASLYRIGALVRQVWRGEGTASPAHEYQLSEDTRKPLLTMAALEAIAKNESFPEGIRRAASRGLVYSRPLDYLVGIATDTAYAREVRLYAHEKLNLIQGTTETLDEADAIATAAVDRAFQLDRERYRSSK